MDSSTILKQYVDVVQKVAKLEHRRIPSHMIEYEELVSIGIIAVQAMVKNKSEEQLANYNDAYMGTAIKWAIRNELRHRYKWYTLKHNKEDNLTDDSEGLEDDGATVSLDISPGKVKEAIYETILSIDGLAAAASDNDSPFDFLKDPSAQPDEKAEIAEMSRMIKEAVAKLPQKDRTIFEYRFYRGMQAKDIAVQVGLSPSRITRIIQADLIQIREYLQSKGRVDF